MATNTVFPRLQELCLLSLINYTTHYTPEYIALLPTKLRRRFVSLLPAVYLQKFHNTPVFSDIQEDEIWLILYTSFYNKEHYLLEGRNQPGHGKESLLNRAIKQAVYYPIDTSAEASNCGNKEVFHIGGVIDALLCIPKSNDWIFSKPYIERLLSAYNLQVMCKECKCICPSQLVSSFPYSFVCWDYQLTNVCSILTNIFDRYASTLISRYNQYGIFIEALNNTSVTRFISKAEELHLHCYSQNRYGNERQCSYKHTQALRLILQSPSSKLRSLFLDDMPKDSLYSELRQIAPFFSPVLPIEGGPRKGLIPYSKLQSLTFIGVDIDNESMSILISIIEHQERLRVFDMTCVSTSNLSLLLYSAICSMKWSGTEFEKLMLRGTSHSSPYTLFLETFTSVLVDFLTVIPPPLSDNKDRQILDLGFVTIVDDSVSSSSSVKELSSNNKKEGREDDQLCCQQVIDCPGKVLRFENIHFTSNAVMNLSQFTNNLSTYHLDEIIICTTTDNYCDLCVWQEVKNFTANKISLELSRGLGGRQTVLDYPLIGDVLREWISCERIQVLELVNVPLLSPSHLLSLTDAFSKSSLTQLVLSDCLVGVEFCIANTVNTPLSFIPFIEKYYNIQQRMQGMTFCGELVELLTSIVSFLLKTDQFELTLKDRSLDNRLLFLIHEIWSRLNKKKRAPFKLLNLKMRLHVPESLKREFMSKMNEMALEFRTT